jgi:hypothetical protein
VRLGLRPGAPRAAGADGETGAGPVAGVAAMSI